MSAAALLPGSIFARDYRIVAPLAQGGMGTIYVAEQISTGKRRALKLMHPTLVSEAEHRERFIREAQVGSRIATEHIVEVTAAGVDDATGLPYLAMELLEGETLQAYVKRRAFLPPSELLAVFQQLCHAMMAAHAAGVVHRDLKPENVFLALSRRAGSAPYVVKVLDFGIAKLAAEAGTRGTTGAMGSPLWMAPEQTERGAITAAADVWALGLIAYFALTGNVFWRAARDPQTTVAQVLREIVLEPIPAASIRANETGLLERLPPGFDRFFAQAVARDPSARFQDATALWSALSALLDSIGATMIAVPSSGMRPQSSGVPSLAPPTPVPITPAVVTPMQPSAPPIGTAPAIASTMTSQSSLGPWIFATALLLVSALGVIAFFALRVRTQSQAAASSAPPAATSTSLAMASAPESSSDPPPLASTTHAPAAATAIKTQVATTATPSATASAPTTRSNATSVSHGTNDSYGDGLQKRRTWKVAGHTIKVVPGNVQATGNVPADVVRDALDWHPWEYLRCYERNFSDATSLPHGTVTLAFKIFDQLPRNGSIDRSDFTNAAFSKCVLDTAMGNTANAAGGDGFATVVYPLIFTVVD